MNQQVQTLLLMPMQVVFKLNKRQRKAAAKALKALEEAQSSLLTPAQPPTLSRLATPSESSNPPSTPTSTCTPKPVHDPQPSPESTTCPSHPHLPPTHPSTGLHKSTMPLNEPSPNPSPSPSPPRPVTPPEASDHGAPTSPSQESTTPPHPPHTSTLRPIKYVPVKSPGPFCITNSTKSTPSQLQHSQSSQPLGPPTPLQPLPGCNSAQSSQSVDDTNAFNAEQQQHKEGSWSDIKSRRNARAKPHGPPAVSDKGTQAVRPADTTKTQSSKAAQRHNAAKHPSRNSKTPTAQTPKPPAQSNYKTHSFMEAAKKAFFLIKTESTDTTTDTHSATYAASTGGISEGKPLIGDKVDFKRLLEPFSSSSTKLEQLRSLCSGSNPFTRYRSIKGGLSAVMLLLYIIDRMISYFTLCYIW